MKQNYNTGKKKKSKNIYGFNDSIILSYLTLAQIQPAINMPLIFLIKTNKNIPPECPDRPETGFCLSPDIQPVISRWSKIKN